MTAKSAFVTMVKSTPGLTAKVYPILPPAEAATPVISYSQVSKVDHTSHDGEVVYTSYRFQLTIWGDDYKQIDYIAKAIKGRLVGLRDTFGSDVIMTTLPAAEVDGVDPVSGTNKVIQDWFVLHTTGPI